MHGRDTRRHHQNQGGNYQNYGHSNGRDGGGAPRNHVIPDEPPFTAYIGNAPDTMVQGDFEKHLFTGLKVKQVRLVRDRQTDRFRGFAYVDFDDADSLRRAIDLDGTCINDRPIRIDVAVRPLGASRPEGFRNNPGFDAPDAHRQQPGNNSRPTGGFRQGGRSNNNNYQYNQQGYSRNATDGYEENQYNHENPAPRNRQSSGSGKTNDRQPNQNQQQQPREHKTPPRKASNDDVFLGPDTPASTEDGTEATAHDESAASTVRQQSRNWADCPIDESVVEPTSPPSSANNTFTNDDFQVVRNKNNRPRAANQQPSSRPMGNAPNRGRGGGGGGGGNYYRGGGPAPMSGGRGYHDQTAPPYMNQSQQYYQHQQQAPPSLHMRGNYSNNQQQQAGPGSNRQRLNSNRSTNSRTQNDNQERTSVRGDSTSNTADENPVAAENRPRLQLLPRTQKQAPAANDNPPADPSARNSNIFGSGKPRDERDPKLVEFNKHIEEVVEKEQAIPRTKSTTSNGSNEGVPKPVRILTAATKSSVDQ